MASRTKSKGRTMPRAYAKLTLTFGMVNIPIAMRPHTGDRRKGVSGRMLCAEHKEPVTQLWQCEHDPEHPHTMKKAETVIGYETAQDSGEYVVLDDEVVASLVEDREQAAAVRQVVPTATIDPAFYEKQYTVWPQEGSGQPHDLFLAVLRTEELSAIFTATISKQTRTFALRWSKKFKCLIASLLFFDTDMRWEDGEVIAASVDDRAGSITDEHVAMARTLVDGLIGEFDPSEVTDTYTEALTEAIDQAAKGVTVTAKAKPKKQDAGADLLATLKASVEASGKPAAKPKRAPKAKASA